MVNNNKYCPANNNRRTGNLSKFSINSSFNQIYANNFIDENLDGTKNSGENAMPNVRYVISKKNAPWVYSSSMGLPMELTIDTGIYLLYLDTDTSLFTILPASATVSHNTYNHSDTVLFALQPKEPIYDASVVMGNEWVTQPGFAGKYHITFTNRGNQRINNLKIKALLDPRLEIDTTTRPYTLAGDTLVFNIGLLNIGETKRIFVDYTAAIPPNLNAGDTLQNEVWAAIPYLEQHPKDNYYLLLDPVLGAYDPNDKTVNTTDIAIRNLASIAEQPLTYTIRFQNEGSYYAQAVRIYDTLPHNVDFPLFECYQPATPSRYNRTRFYSTDYF